MKKNILILLVFIFLIIIVTFPLVFKITTHIPGFFSTDEPYATLWSSWRIKYSFQNNLPLRNTNLIAYPFGLDLFSSAYFSYLWMGWHHLLSLLSSPVLAWNIQILLNLSLSALFTYLLTFSLTQNRFSAILGGIIFSFCPYQFMRIWQHLGLTYNQWLPLILFSAILFREISSKKHLIFFALSLFLLLSFDWSIMYLGGVSLFCSLIYVFFYHWRIKFFQQKEFVFEDFKYLKRITFIGIFSFFILLPQFLSVIKSRLSLSSITSPSIWNPYHRPFEDLFIQSAKPLSYLLPAIVHPIFGKFTEKFIGSSLYGISFTEHTLYLGWVPLLLAFLTFKRWRILQKTKDERRRTKDEFYIGFFVFLAIVAWFFSQPPWWKFGPIRIYMPSFFMYKVLPMFRAYCRFGIAVMLAIAVLAGFGLKFILERFKSQKIKIVLTCLFSGLVLLEFWNYPPFKVIDVSKVPTVYYWLKGQPGDFVIAEYPLDADSPNEMYKFYQTKHEKKIINSTIPGTYANKVAQTITKLSDPNTAGVLKWMGVKYVIVHKQDYLNTELIEQIEELNKISKNPGLKFIKSFPTQECLQEDIMCVQKTDPIDVYEVVAQPTEPIIGDRF